MNVHVFMYLWLNFMYAPDVVPFSPNDASVAVFVLTQSLRAGQHRYRGWESGLCWASMCLQLHVAADTLVGFSFGYTPLFEAPECNAIVSYLFCAGCVVT